MTEDLFEEENENEKKSSEEETEVFADDEEAWIPLDDKDLELSPADEETDALSEDEEISDEVMDEVYAAEEEVYAAEEEEYEEEEEELEIDLEGEMEEVSEGEEAAPFSDEEEAWIPLEDEDLELSPADEEIDALSEDEEISDEELDEGYEELELEMDSDLEESSEEEETGVFANDEYGETEAPPWDEGVEIPVHGATGPPKKKNTLMILCIFALLALLVLGLYAFLQSRRTSVTEDIKPEEEKPLFVTKKMEKMPVKKAEPEKIVEEKPAPELTATKVNTAPIISGTPVTNVMEGTAYRFIPKASDLDPGDKLIFFIANQPAWTSFDTNNGALTGIPRSKDVGTYENIVILVSDGTATASLPGFAITVKGVRPLIAKEQKVQQEKIAVITSLEKEKPSVKKPESKKEEAKKAEVAQYMLPDLTDLIKQSQFQDAALEYYQEVKQFPKAYALKLEVDCVDESLQVAYQRGNFDRRMFILPKNIRGKDCFVVFWGPYATKTEAIKALSSIPAFFSKQQKPELVLLKQYL